MSHRRARKDAKKAAALRALSIVSDNMNQMPRHLIRYRALFPKQPRNYRPRRGPGYTRPSLLARKARNRAAAKRARTARKRNRIGA